MMRVILQRVLHGQVRLDGRTTAEIGSGLLIFLGIGPQDGETEVDYLTDKIAHLRVFEDEEGKTNRSILDVHGEALVVSQFTLYADTRKGRRPSFTRAAGPEVARPLVDLFVAGLREKGVPTKTGVFGATMEVELINYGPMTIWIER